MSFSPSPLQAKAIAAIKDWFTNRTAAQQVFRVFGYAGTGKTTITRHAIAELGLDTGASDGVLYAAFTGKAALVMTRKGTPASTIHSLIYRVSEATPAEIEKVKEEIADLKAKIASMAAAERLFAESQLRSLELRLSDIHKPRFVLNEQSMLRGGQVICGRNATRLQLNLAMKRASGFDGVYPTGQGEKIICLKNRNDLGLVNGMFLDLAEVKDEDEISFTAVVTTEDGQKIGGTNGARERFRIYKGYFDDHVTPDP